MPYPCVCVPCSGCVSVPSCPDNSDCLKVASITIFSDTSFLPCGTSGTVDVGTESDLSVCTTTVNWGIVSYDSVAFTGVSINSSGVLSFTTTTATELNTFYTFVGRVTCSGTMLSQLFEVKISVKNACLDVMCGEGESCNPCDGTCFETPPDVEIS